MTSFGEPVPDHTGELRLQLHHAEVQREAFRALGHRDVQALIREALASHLSEMCEKLRNEITRMEGENHRLRVELTDCKSEADRLKAEVERLRKAGDALVGEGETMAHEVSWIPYTWDNLVIDWNAAKDGKPTE